MSLEGMEEKKYRSPEARLKKQSEHGCFPFSPRFQLAPCCATSELRTPSEHPESFVGCSRQAAGASCCPWAWAGQNLSVQSWRKACLQRCPPSLSTSPVLYIREALQTGDGDQRLAKLPALRSGAVPELGAWLQQQICILVAREDSPWHLGVGHQRKKRE